MRNNRVLSLLTTLVALVLLTVSALPAAAQSVPGDPVNPPAVDTEEAITLQPDGAYILEPGAFKPKATNACALPPPQLVSPVGGTINILMPDFVWNATATAADNGSVQLFGQGYALGKRAIAANQGASAQLSIPPDGTGVAYHAGSGSQISLDRARESVDASQSFGVSGLSVQADAVLTVSVESLAGDLVLNNLDNGTGAYDFVYTRATLTGLQVFATDGVDITATDTHSIDYGTWDGTGAITLTVDIGSTGTQTKTVVLENKFVPRIFLPQVSQ